MNHGEPGQHEATIWTGADGGYFFSRISWVNGETPRRIIESAPLYVAYSMTNRLAFHWLSNRN